MRTIVSATLILPLLAAAPAPAADLEAGKVKYATCAACHGANGVSVNPPCPNLAGRDANYVKEALNAFRSGSRPATVMQGMAAGLGEADIENLAAYIASLPKP